MKKNALFIAAILLAALWLAASAGCETNTPAKPEVISVKILRNGKEVTSAISAKQGTTVIFTADVEVKGKASQDVTWSVSGGKSKFTKTNDDRASLKIADDETVGADLTVTAFSTENFRKLATATVNVQSKGGVPDDPIIGGDITISTEGNATQVAQGDTLQFSVDVDENGDTPSVTWTISSGGRIGTSIDRESGLLRVGAQQPAGPLTIRASTDDPEVFAEITVTVTANNIPTPPLPTSYTITYNRPFANGDVTGPAEAEQNTTVTLNIAPQANFRLSTLTVTGTPSGNITVYGSGSTRTFTMPSSGVTVTAIFAERGFISTDYSSKDFDEDLCSFYDKFEGGSLDLSRWAYQNGTGNWGWGNGELQYYHPNNVTVSGGVLRLEARKEGNGYRSGKLVTANGSDNESTGQNGPPKFGQTYGRIEAKIRMRRANSDSTANMEGMWPAFWMMPVRSEYGGWPRSGEIDIMEMKGRTPNRASSTVHYQSPWNNIGTSTYYGVEETFQNGGTFADWHVYGCVWHPNNGISFIIDNKLTRRLEYGNDRQIRLQYYDGSGAQTSNPLSPQQGPFNKDFHLIFNLAVGGQFDNWATPPDASLPVYLEIEWVRCYTLENDPWTIDGDYTGNKNNYNGNG